MRQSWEADGEAVEEKAKRRDQKWLRAYIPTEIKMLGGSVLKSHTGRHTRDSLGRLGGIQGLHLWMIGSVGLLQNAELLADLTWETLNPLPLHNVD